MGGWPTVERQAQAQFGLLGEVESIKGLPSQGVVFVRYRCRVNAEFAREAMIGQSMQQMGDGEVLRIKWAKEDPDPVMKEQNKYETLSKLWEGADDRGAATDIHVHKKARVGHTEKYVRLCAVEELYVKPAPGSAMSAALPSEVHYPDTDSQYPVSVPEEGQAGWIWDSVSQSWIPPQSDGWRWHETKHQWVSKEEHEAEQPLSLVAGYASD